METIGLLSGFLLFSVLCVLPEVRAGKHVSLQLLWIVNSGSISVLLVQLQQVCSCFAKLSVCFGC